MKRSRMIRVLPVDRVCSKTGGIVLFFAFLFVILSLLNCPAQNTGSMIRTPHFIADSVPDIQETGIPETRHDLADGAQTLRDPICKRLLLRRPCKPVQSAGSGTIFHTKDVIFLAGPPTVHFFKNFNYIPLQLRNSLFVRAGPVPDVTFPGTVFGNPEDRKTFMEHQ